jgi:hypothetical protein
MFLSVSGAEGFSHGYVVFSAWLAGTGIALTIIGSVVSALRGEVAGRREPPKVHGSALIPGRRLISGRSRQPTGATCHRTPSPSGDDRGFSAS